MQQRRLHPTVAIAMSSWVWLVGATLARSQPIVPAADGTGTTVISQGSQFTVQGGTQAGTNLFHSFQQFGLNSGQIATFLAQPGIQNILSRVIGGDPSVINGLLQVTGAPANLYLMNPSGIVFGATASLNVPASFTATTATGLGFGGGWFNAFGINDYRHLVGNPVSLGFTATSAGGVINQGTLAVGAGQSIRLIGGTVINTGTLFAPGGAIAIAAVPNGNLVRLSQEGAVLSFEVPSSSLGFSSLPNQMPASFQARSLPELLTGNLVGHATAITVNADGTVQLSGSGSAIAALPGSAIVGGQVSVNQPAISQRSALHARNSLTILGDRVSLVGAQIDASGASGGTVLIGGDYQGSGTLPTAQFTLVDQTTVIRADGLRAEPEVARQIAGLGGRVIIWATDRTDFAGTVTARGVSPFANSQDPHTSKGGFVETSGKHSLTIAPTARVDTSAANGQIGTWLLDPADLEVVASGGVAGIIGSTNSPAAATTIDAGTIVTALNSTNLNLQATNSITVNAAIDASGNTNTGNLSLTTPTIYLNAAIVLKPGATLSGTATTVNVGASGQVQNGVDAAAIGGIVNLAAATYTLAAPVDISKDLTLQGAGASQTIVSGNNAVSVFAIGNGTITLQDLTIGNGSTSGSGAGINYSGTGILTIRNSAIANNAANSVGGGIFKSPAASGTLNITNTTVSGNTASNGGGIYVQRGITNITNSTIAYNAADTDGGGIRSADSIFGTTQLNITNSTISGNRAGVDGGGIGNTIATLTILNSTITANIADSNRNNSGNGGGILTDGGTVSLRNSLVAGNLDASPASGTIHPDVSGTFADQGNNLIAQSDGSASFTNGVTGNLVGTSAQPIDPKLAPLGDYGGSTPTHALLPDSPAINAAAIATATDQRGISRPQSGAPDIGAFEVAGYTLTAITGDDQRVPLGAPFPNRLGVRVTENGFGVPVSNVRVTFTVPATGARGLLSSVTSISDPSGLAFTTITANAIAGSYLVIGSTTGASSVANFNLTNVSLTNGSLSFVPQSAQLVLPCLDLTDPIRDQFLQALSEKLSILEIEVPVATLCVVRSVRKQRQGEIDEFQGLPDCPVMPRKRGE